MIPIGNVDWNAIRAEYIGGGISQRKLAEKHGVSADVLMQKANRERWKKDRDKTLSKATARIQQKIAETAADNATIAQDLKKRLLLRLQRIEAKYPFDATEIKTHEGKNTVTFRIRDLTAAYKDLADGLPMTDGDKNTPIYELLRKLDGECGVINDD